MGILSILFFALSALSLFGVLFFMVPFYITITFLLAGIVSYWMKSILDELKQINETLLNQPNADYEGILRNKGESQDWLEEALKKRKESLQEEEPR